MKIKKTSKLLALILILILAITACSPKAPAQDQDPQSSLDLETGDYEYPEMTIIVAHPSVTTDVRHAGWEKANEYIMEKSNGKINFDIYPAGQLGTTRETTEATSTGAIQMSQNPPSNIEPFAPLLGVINIPFLLPNDIDNGKKVIKGPAGDALLESATKGPSGDSGLIGVSLWDTLCSCYTSNKDFRDTGDLTGQKIRIMASKISESNIKSWNGTPIVMDLSEVYTALQTGSIDGQESGIGGGTFSNKYYEVQKYLFRFNHVRPTLLTIANKDWWNGLDSEVRDLIKESVEVGGELYDKLTLERENEALEVMSKHLEVIEPTPEQIKKLKDMAQQPAIDLYLESVGEDGRKLLDAFLSETSKYEN